MSLKPVDLRVLDAFLKRRSAEGKFLSTDGEVLYRQGLLSSPFALWELEHISIVGVLSVRADDAIMRALRKRVPEDLIRARWLFPPDLIFENQGDLPTAPVYGQVTMNQGKFHAFIPYSDHDLWAGSFDWGQLDKVIQIAKFQVYPDLNKYLVYRRMKEAFERLLPEIPSSFGRPVRPLQVQDSRIKF